VRPNIASACDARGGQRASVQEAAVLPLTAWTTFYIIIGSSAGTLTGLTFVAISLLAGRPRLPNLSGGIATYNTPTIVHFGATLFICTFLRAYLGKGPT
jgi:hypothetical protein